MYIRTYTLFSTFHPVVLFFYAMGAPVLSMISHQTGFVMTALFMAVICHGFYCGIFSTVKSAAALLPFLLLIAVLNMISNPQGETVILMIGHRVFTWESLRYGLVSASMLMAVLLWFRCFSAVIDQQKFLYLFGRRFPGLALLLSMILKLFPETEYKIACIKRAQVVKEKRLANALRQISTLLEWSMEDGMETADSMKARGYGSKKRGQYEQYRFLKGDVMMLLLMSVLAAITVTGLVMDSDTEMLWAAGGLFFGMPLWVEAGGKVRQITGETIMRRRKEYETFRNE